MTGGGYQTGKNPAFQFAGDLMGGYPNPYQQMAWMLHGGGLTALKDLYNGYDMQFVGWWIPGQESWLLPALFGWRLISKIGNSARLQVWQQRSLKSWVLSQS